MSITTELQALEGFISDSYDAVLNKNGVIPQDKNMNNLPTAINSIQKGQIVIPPDAGTLTSINVIQPPTKTSYYAGEYFNPAGCVVMATYTNTTIDVSSVCTFIVNTPLQATDTSVQVSYEGLTTSFSITVSYPPVPAPLSTKLLMHLNGNLVNEVTGNTTGITGNYVSATGVFNTAGHNTSNTNNIIYMSGFGKTQGASNYGIGWWAYNSGAIGDSARIGAYNLTTQTYVDLVLIWMQSGHPGIRPGNSAFSHDNNSFSSSISVPTYQYVYFAFQIINDMFYGYINGNLVYTCRITETKVDLNDLCIMCDSDYLRIDEIIIADDDIYQVNNAEWSIQ